MYTCTQIHLFKEQITPFHSVASGEKRATRVTIIRSLGKDRLSLHALKYVHSKATYMLSMIEFNNFTV